MGAVAKIGVFFAKPIVKTVCKGIAKGGAVIAGTVAVEVFKKSMADDVAPVVVDWMVRKMSKV